MFFIVLHDLALLQARIKKIMQADEDVGKIALAVPVLVCELPDLLGHSGVFFVLYYLFIYFIAYIFLLEY